jgi:hypothetical protein
MRKTRTRTRTKVKRSRRCQGSGRGCTHRFDPFICSVACRTCRTCRGIPRPLPDRDARPVPPLRGGAAAQTAAHCPPHNTDNIANGRPLRPLHPHSIPPLLSPSFCSCLRRLPTDSCPATPAPPRADLVCFTCRLLHRSQSHGTWCVGLKLGPHACSILLHGTQMGQILPCTL